jgi:hypothetical protein
MSLNPQTKSGTTGLLENEVVCNVWGVEVSVVTAPRALIHSSCARDLI